MTLVTRAPPFITRTPVSGLRVLFWRACTWHGGVMASVRYLPPAVQYPVSPPAVLWGAGVLLWSIGATLLLAWWGWGGAQPWSVMGSGWLLWLGGGAAWASWVWGLPQGSLRWDGGAWWWVQGDAGAAERPLQSVRVRWDWQSAMGLSWQASDGRWRHGLVLQRRAPWCWGDWRRAVYSAATVSRAAGDRP